MKFFPLNKKVSHYQDWELLKNREKELCSTVYLLLGLRIRASFKRFQTDIKKDQVRKPFSPIIAQVAQPLYKESYLLLKYSRTSLLKKNSSSSNFRKELLRSITKMYNIKTS